MKKLVPDPPTFQAPNCNAQELKAVNQAICQTLALQPHASALLVSLKATIATPVSQHSLFAVRAGINAEEALLHVSLLLKCAEQVCDEITEQGSGVERGLIGSVVHCVEMARAVVDALVDGATP